MALHGNLDCHGYPGWAGSVCGSVRKLTRACASVLLATPAPAGGEPPVPGPGALGTWQNRPANSALLRFAPWPRQILRDGVPKPGCALRSRPRCCQVPAWVQRGSFCLVAACAAGRGRGTFPVVRPSVPPPPLQVSSRDSPGGARPGVCGALAALAPVPVPRRGFAFRRGLTPKAGGPEEPRSLASLVRAAGSVCIRRGSAGSLGLLSWQDHTYEMPDFASPGALQRDPIRVGSDVPSTLSWHQVRSPAIARAGLLLPIRGENGPKACGSSSCSRLRARLRSGFDFPEGFAVPLLLGWAFLP